MLTAEEPARVFKAGQRKDFSEIGVYNQFLLTEGTWVVRLPDRTLIALSASCPHDGCTTSRRPGEGNFKCPCCGSEFATAGTTISGPAQRALQRYKVKLENESIVVDRSLTFREEANEWSAPEASLRLP